MKWYVLTGIAVAGTAVVAGLGYFILAPRRKNDEPDPQTRFTGEQLPETDSTPEITPRYIAPSSPASGFPLKRGSRGEYVRNLQNALIQKFGATILPKYGADGSWGSEMDKALSSKGLLTSIDQTSYTDYVTGNFGGSSPSANTPKSTASTITNDIKSLVVPSWIVDVKVATGYKLFGAAKAKNFSETLSLLKSLTSVTDYTSASKGFQLRPWKMESSFPLYIPSPKRYTLVTGLFDAFTSQNEKNQIRSELRRMGLKETVKNSDPANYDSTWSLSGLGNAHRNIRTTMRAIISDGFNVRLEIPARTILGQWLSSGNGYTRFRSADGRDLYVRSNAVVFA